MLNTIVRTLFSVLCCFVPSFAQAQDISLAKTRGPHYVGEPVVVQVSVDSSDDSQEVTCRFGGDTSDAFTVAGPGVNTSTQESMQIINGRVTRSRKVSYDFTFQVTAHQEGELEVGPFIVSIDGREQTVRGTSFEFEKLQNDPDMEIHVEIADDKIYVGEHVPVKISWVFAGELNELQHAFPRLRIRSPLFDQFEFEDKPVQTRTILQFETATDSAEIDAIVSEEVRNGRKAVVVSGQRTLLAEHPGETKNLVVTCRTERVTRWTRDFFGGLRAGASRPAVASSSPVSFTIHPLPAANRPGSFAGAVGKGFSIEVSADRSVVRVGDPISLDVVVRGNGNLEKLSLPSLSSADALLADLFQLPNEMPAGSYSDNAKQFKVSLRVKDESVNQIPAIPFSWFDPESERYETTFSKPIALQVKEAQMVSAADVVTTTPPRQTKEARSSGSPTSPVKTLNFVGANLAIERNTSRLLATNGLLSNPWALFGVYAAGVLSVSSAVWIRKRKAEDPAAKARKNQLKSIRKRITAARSLEPRDGVAQIASALRTLVAEKAGSDRRDAEQVIAECESLLYSSEPVEKQQLDRLVTCALSAADPLLKE